MRHPFFGHKTFCNLRSIAPRSKGLDLAASGVQVAGLMAQKSRHNDRRCVASGEALPPDAMALRFVRGPGNQLVPDLAEKLPGRGAWLTANRSALLSALKRGGFAKSFRGDVVLPPEQSPEEFADRVKAQLRDRTLASLGFARAAGEVTFGYDRVRAALPRALAYLSASDAAPDGVRKLSSVLAASGTVPHIDSLADSEALSQAVGEFGLVHLALLPGAAGRKALADLRRWWAF